MRKTIVFFLAFFSFFSTSQAQKVAYTEQEFVFRDVTVKDKKSPFKGSIAFSFKLFGKYNRDHVQAEENSRYPSYQIRFFILDVNGDTLVSPSDFSSKQNYSFFDVDTGKYKSYSFGHNFEIPYQAFKKKGDIRFVIWAQPENSSGTIKLALFKSGIFHINISNTVPLEKQQIKLSHVSAVEDLKQQGVTIKFSSIFSHDITELYSDKENWDEVLFFVDFTDTEGNPISSPNSPELLHNRKNRRSYYKLSHVKNKLRNGELFFPYTDFYLPKGTQKIKYTIHAISYNYSATWRNLASGEVIIAMPGVYFAKAAVTGMHVVEKSYDVAGKDIPFLNLFIPSNSSSGKGYPDIFWELGSDTKNYILTDVSSNSFYAKNDSISFQMMEDDLLYLRVYDHDVLSGDDFLGGINIPKLVGPKTYQATLKNGDIIGGNFFLKRDLRPDAKAISLYVKNTQFQGISGYQIWGNIEKNSSVFARFFLRMPDGTNETPKWTNFTPMPEGANFSYFVPAWDLKPGTGFGILALDTYYRLPLTQKYATPKTYITESRDVALKINPLQVTQRNGVEGILVSANIAYPQELGDTKKQVKFMYQFKDLSGVDLKKIIDKLALDSSPICSSQTCPMSVFIPYYLLDAFSQKELRAYVKMEISVKDNFIIGKDEDTLTVAVPAIVPAPKAQLSLNLKFAKDWSYVNMVTEYNGVQKICVKEKSEGGKITVDLEFPTTYMAENDLVSIAIIPYQFRSAKEPIRWTFSVKSLRDGAVKFSKNKYAKKVSLKTN